MNFRQVQKSSSRTNTKIQIPIF